MGTSPGLCSVPGLHINTCSYCSSVFRTRCFQNTLKLRFISKSEKPRKIVHLCLDTCIWLCAKVVGHPPDMGLKVQSRVEGLWDPVRDEISGKTWADTMPV